MGESGGERLEKGVLGHRGVASGEAAEMDSCSEIKILLIKNEQQQQEKSRKDKQKKEKGDVFLVTI